MGILEASIIAAGFAMAIGSLMTGLGQGITAGKAVEGISRQPEAAGKIQGAMILALAFIESIAIYVLAIAIIILFANPFTAPAMSVEKAKAEVEVLKLEMEKIKLEKELSAVRVTTPKTEKTKK